MIIEEYQYSKIELVFEISRYLNIDPLKIEKLLENSVDGIDLVLDYVNKHNMIIWDVIVPVVFAYYYNVTYKTESESKLVPLIKDVSDDKMLFKVKEELLININDIDIRKWKEKSFHVDQYCFDSKPELEFFLQFIKSEKVKEIYFTGMFTSKKQWIRNSIYRSGFKNSKKLLS